MGYQELYNFCQTLTPPISRSVIKEKVLEISGLSKVAQVRTGLDVGVTRGFFLSASNQDHHLIKQHGCDVIVVARGLNPCWDRFVYTKELMHVFDKSSEKTKDAKILNKLLSEFEVSEPQRSPQMDSEVLCIWKALAVLCPEDERLRLQVERAANRLNDYAVALALRIPQQYITHLLGPNYPGIIKQILDEDSSK